MNSFLLYHENGLVGLKSFVPCDHPIVVSFPLENSSETSAEIFLFVRKEVENPGPLTLSVGDETYLVEASPTHFRDGDWLRCTLDPTSLRVGDNVLTIHPQPDWALAKEARSGAYVVRLRVTDDGAIENAVFPSYGDPSIEQNRDEWLALLPSELRLPVLKTDAERWNWCWNLAGFLSTAWEYSNCFDGDVYAPWDTRIILKWARAQRDENGSKPIAMCVHYAIAFVQLCTAMDIPARVVVLSPSLKLISGHFVAEVWLDEFQTWAMLDPNMHLAYKETDSGRPLAVAELASIGEALQPLAEFGSGWQVQSKRFLKTVAQDYLTGKVYRLWGTWRQHNWIEQPELAPPAHGAMVYCETDIIWCAEDEEIKDELAMFPYLSTAEALSYPPMAERTSL